MTRSRRVKGGRIRATNTRNGLLLKGRDNAASEGVTDTFVFRHKFAIVTNYTRIRLFGWSRIAGWIVTDKHSRRYKNIVVKKCELSGCAYPPDASANAPNTRLWLKRTSAFQPGCLPSLSRARVQLLTPCFRQNALLCKVFVLSQQFYSPFYVAVHCTNL